MCPTVQETSIISFVPCKMLGDGSTCLKVRVIFSVSLVVNLTLAVSGLGHTLCTRLQEKFDSKDLYRMILEIGVKFKLVSRATFTKSSKDAGDGPLC